MYFDDSIAFPIINFSVNPPREAFFVLGIPIYWYGLIIAFGFFLGLVYALKKIKKTNISEDDFLTLLIISMPAAIICARAYYVIFNLSQYMRNNSFDFLSAVSIRDGGLAIYGGVIGGLLGAFLVCRVKKISFLKIADIVSISFLIGQAIGRWGNFINREAYGAVTDLPFGMVVYDNILKARVMVHPTFLYESVWNAIGFIILHKYYEKRKFDGEIFLGYVCWYGLGRAFIEGLRADSLYLFNTGIRISQLIAILSFIISAFLIIYIRNKRKTAKKH